MGIVWQLRKQLNLKLVTLRPCDYIPRYRPNGNENVSTQNLHTDVCSSTICTAKKEKQFNITADKWMERDGTHPNHRTSLGLAMGGIGHPHIPIWKPMGHGAFQEVSEVNEVTGWNPNPIELVPK